MKDEQEFIAKVKAGDLAGVERMLDDQPELAAASSGEVPALMLAAYYSHPAIAGAIASRKAEMSLFEAATVGDGEYLESKLSRDPSEVNAFSADGFSALGFAAYFGHLDAATVLLRHGANPSLPSRNPLGVLPLHSALSGGHTELVHLLVESSSPIDTPSAEGWTPLHYTAHAGSDELTEYLLGRGAQPRPGPEGKTPAEIAGEAGHAALADRLRRAEQG